MALRAPAEAIWITWEDHRRSRVLAAALGCAYRPLLRRAAYGPRVAVLGWRTLRLLLRRRPRLLFVQNPSLALTTLACLLRPLLGYVLVVDRHSNFTLRTLTPPPPVRWAFDSLSRFTNRHADLTIVTNETLRKLATDWRGRGFVLQDKLPEMDLAEPVSLPGRRNFVFVCTYSSDEPVREVVEAARRLPADHVVHVTGDTARADPALLRGAPDNVVFTGFLPETEYQSLLAASDGVLALTTQPLTLLCCAYEAVSLRRPLILSHHEDLLAYFRLGAVPTDNSAESLAAAMREAAERHEELAAEAAELAVELPRDWDARFAELLAEIDRLVGRS